MIRHLVVILAFFVFSPMVVASERYQAALADFDFVTSKVESNYAGWDDKMSWLQSSVLMSRTEAKSPYALL
jgi:hypothetical protein